MVLAHGPHKVERVTITLVPDRSAEKPFAIPSTFNKIERTYGWKRTARLEYMIVPTRISSDSVKVDLFFSPSRGARLQARQMLKAVQEFVEQKVGSEWEGLRLAGIGKPSPAAPPTKMFVRGTIEDMLGTSLER
jgi:hypothetical protein